MMLSPAMRKLALAVHLTVSIGWIGAVAAYLSLDVAAVTGHQEATLRAAYLGMHRIAGVVIVPLAIAALVTGVVVSLGTKWGLFRHSWVVISLILTAIALAVLLVEVRTIAHLAAVAADPATSPERLRALPGTLPHSIGGTVVLLSVLVLNVYKPRGLTPYGWRSQRAESAAASHERPA